MESNNPSLAKKSLFQDSRYLSLARKTELSDESKIDDDKAVVVKSKIGKSDLGEANHMTTTFLKNRSLSVIINP